MTVPVVLTARALLLDMDGTLVDTAATKKAMMAGIKALVKASKKGDVALLHYSGHGSHVPDDEAKRIAVGEAAIEARLAHARRLFK